MLTPLLLGAIAMLLAFAFLSDSGDLFGRFLLSLVMGMIGFIIGMFLSLFLGLFAPKEIVKTEIPLVAFSDGQSIHGNFFLGIGSINGEDVYSFYKRREDGGIERGRVKSANIPIYEEDRKDGVLEIYKRKVVGTWALWADVPQNTRYEFHLPEGTVVRQFVADLK